MELQYTITILVFNETIKLVVTDKDGNKKQDVKHTELVGVLETMKTSFIVNNK